MKIAILTSGILPVPAVQGGAVENLIDMYLAFNDQHQLHDITIYSIAHDEAKRHPALSSKVNHYRYIDTKSVVAKLRKKLHKAVNGQEYYHYTIEYYLEQALQHIQNHDYDAVIVENRPGYVLKLASQTPARIILHLHNDFLNSSIPHAKEIYDSATRIITISDFITSRVRTIQADDKKCVMVYNGLDLDRFSPEHATPANRESLGIGQDDFVLIFTGRVIPEKGIDKLIQAMLLLKEYQHIRLLVLGSSFYANEQTDNEFVSNLKERARELGDRLIFTGYTPYEKVPSMLALANVAVLPSVWDEPFGMACLEAMSMGLPVITTDRGGIKEVANSSTAIIVPADDRLPSRLAVAILDLYNAPDRCKEMGQQAHLTAQYFSKDIFAQKLFLSLL